MATVFPAGQEVPACVLARECWAVTVALHHKYLAGACGHMSQNALATYTETFYYTAGVLFSWFLRVHHMFLLLRSDEGRRLRLNADIKGFLAHD